MQSVRFNRTNGFTLLETVVYIALLAILIGGGMIGVFNILEGSGRTRQSMYREQEAYFITRKIDAVISEATSIDEPDVSSASTTSGQLTVQAGAETIVINHSGEEILLTRDGTPYELNDALVPATALSFYWNNASNTIVTTFTLDDHPYSVSNYYYE